MESLVLRRSLVISFLFFLMIRRPPRSTLFPTRRSSDLAAATVPSQRKQRSLFPGRTGSAALGCGVDPGPWTLSCRPRSEEHTSELQSHSDLVCRLLLEKKNTKE